MGVIYGSQPVYLIAFPISRRKPAPIVLPEFVVPVGRPGFVPVPTERLVALAPLDGVVWTPRDHTGDLHVLIREPLQTPLHLLTLELDWV